MAKLIINPTSSSRREIALARTIVSIGRDPSNDVVLPDAMVSRRHAVIECRGSQYYVRDCNSSNGSVVNGDRVNERNLRDGDLVAIGTARLLFRDDVPDSGAKVVHHPSSPRLECSSCQSEYRKGDLFCRECGAAIAPSGPPRIVCASCGSAVLLPARFCNACGTPLSPDGQRVDGAKPPGEPVPARSAAPASGPSLPLGALAYYWSLRELSEVSFVPVLASVPLSVLALLLGAAYFIGFWGLRGATPGKRLLGLRVTDEAGQGPIGLARAALRFLGYLLSAASLGIGFLMVAFVGDGLHDRIAGTHVVRGGARKA